MTQEDERPWWIGTVLLLTMALAVYWTKWHFADIDAEFWKGDAAFWKEVAKVPPLRIEQPINEPRQIKNFPTIRGYAHETRDLPKEKPLEIVPWPGALGFQSTGKTQVIFQGHDGKLHNQIISVGGKRYFVSGTVKPLD